MRRGFIVGELTLNLVFPWIYTLFFAFVLAILFKGTKIVLFPMPMLIFDYLENAAIVFLLIRYLQEFSAFARGLFGVKKGTPVDLRYREQIESRGKAFVEDLDR